MKKISKIYRALLLLAPIAFFFSFWPALSFGESDTMHFKLPLVLIWLVVFDIVSICFLFVKKSFKDIKKYSWLLLLPVFIAVSLIWSQNVLRGLFTAGVVWLIVLAIISLLLFGKEQFDKKFQKNFLKVFFGSSVVVSIFCVLQCILDLVGVSREATLMCAGCTYGEFGFPHPNGFAIEPQFMGNLLIAPTMLAGYYMLRERKYGWLFFFLSFALFLTFSRGAIFAFIISMAIYTIVNICRTKKWQILILWPVIILAFLFTLNLQGIFAQASKTNDTYLTGVSKAINHLSLGKIELNKPNSGEVEVVEEKEEAAFDGYVESSTTGRIEITKAMLKTWAKNPKNVILGVGFGGAGVAMYEAGEMEYAGEVGQNFYASTLLETGLIGVGLFVFAVIMTIKRMAKMNGRGIVLTLMFAYAITMMFFAGYINAIHIFLLPVMLVILRTNQLMSPKRKP